MSKNVIVIGGGASGMVASIAAARNRHNVTVFEKNEKLGKKVLLTGNGRCNLTNVNISWQNYFGAHPKFTASVLAKFSNKDTMKFFEELGLVLIEEDNGRIFPRSNQAQSVIDILEEELERLKVEIKYNQKIKSLGKTNKEFEVTTYQGKSYQCDKLIIATGGKTYPKTGSTGDGYRFAVSFGHKIVLPFPVSTPFRIKSIVCNKLQGIKVNARLKVIYNNKVIADNTGEVLFTHLGISAPAVLESSREVSKILSKDQKAQISCSINLFPEYSNDQLRSLLLKKIKNHPDRKFSSQFIGMLPKKVAPTILKYSNIDPEVKSKDVSRTLLHQVVLLLTDYRLQIIGVLGWDIAQFTAGGVDTNELNSQTMESKLVPGLYFCGEVVDIDGQSGGYNLQWAWSSGWVSGSTC